MIIFSKKDLEKVKQSPTEFKVDVEFSEGTYQGSVVEIKTRRKYWPFLQLSEDGRAVVDGFCSCGQEKESCLHLAALYLKICADETQPALHVRFRTSFWNQLCQRAWERQRDIVKKGISYVCLSETNKPLFSITANTAAMRTRLKTILLDRRTETEETSIKFFNVSVDELTRWRAGSPSPQLHYELSAWSDLAKMMMWQAAEGQEYQITFEPQELPQVVHIHFVSVDLDFYIARVDWPLLIPSLSSVKSPLQVFDFQEYAIKSLTYDEKRRVLCVSRVPFAGRAHGSSPHRDPEGVIIGDWKFVPEVGFFPKQPITALDGDELEMAQLKNVLTHYPTLLAKYLVNVRMHLQGVGLQYELSMDPMAGLHISCYLFEKGDLHRAGSCDFGSWVYLEANGFYRIAEPLFEGVDKVVPFSQMNDFINRHRAWLNGFEGFQTHIYQLESRVHFEMTPAGVLKFSSVVDAWENPDEGVIDFGEWVYFAGKGFFPKKLGKEMRGIQPGAVVPRDKIPLFIQLHKEELEWFPGFFSSKAALKKSGLQISLNADREIVVRPCFEWHQGYDTSSALVFGGYTYVAGEGFAPFPAECVLPEKYVQERVIKAEDEPYFVGYELDQLASYTVELDPELKKPKALRLHLVSVEKKSIDGNTHWAVDAELSSELGSVELFVIWQAMQEGKKYVFSKAGCLFLNSPRFSWLKSVTKRQWIKKMRVVKLSAIEWFRLCAFEEVQHASTLSWQEELSSNLALKLEGFKSELRGYQEIGVRWLFSLYVHGLSGLLCDEMGLGKTHQAMGLMSAVLNSQPQGSPKVLIVCPTSVIYHWEALLQRFLQGRTVVVFYGMNRSVEPLQEGASILLTSYGTLRSEAAVISQIPFELSIFDELQVAKNSRSQTHKALRKLDTKMRLGLTGTPIENRLLELKALFDVIVPTYFPSEAQFKEMFVFPIEKHQDSERKSLLARLIKPFILRRKKTEVLLELPEKIEEISYCPLLEDQQALYSQVCAANRERLIGELEDEARPVSYLHVFSLLSQLKQICDHPCLINKDFANFHKYRSGKWELFTALLQESRDSGQKVVVFSQYLDMLNIMQMYLDQEGIGYTGIRGSTRDRKEPLERFKTDPKCEVFLASLQAAGVGVDLVSASVVIHYDRWWNPAKENQATDRVHRMGQNRGVQVFKMVTKGTIEEHIHELIERKKNLMEGVIGFDEQDQIKGFTREELLSLMRLLETSE